MEFRPFGKPYLNVPSEIEHSEREISSAWYGYLPMTERKASVGKAASEKSFFGIHIHQEAERWCKVVRQQPGKRQCNLLLSFAFGLVLSQIRNVIEVQNLKYLFKMVLLQLIIVFCQSQNAQIEFKKSLFLNKYCVHIITWMGQSIYTFAILLQGALSRKVMQLVFELYCINAYV